MKESPYLLDGGLLEEWYAGIHARDINVDLSEGVLVNGVHAGVVILVNEVEILLPFPLECLLATIDVCRKIPLQEVG